MTEDFIQENEDRELFRRIKQGSEEAFRVVYGKYHRILYAVALKMLKDRSAAENAAQHVFVKLWIGRQEMTVMLSLRNYLCLFTTHHLDWIECTFCKLPLIDHKRGKTVVQQLF